MSLLKAKFVFYKANEALKSSGETVLFDFGRGGWLIIASQCVIFVGLLQSRTPPTSENFNPFTYFSRWAERERRGG